MRLNFFDKQGVFISWRNLGLLMLVSPFAVVGGFLLLRLESAPQWFQAIGTVGAVAAAIQISKMEEQRRRRERQEEAAIRIKNVLAISRAVANEIADIFSRAAAYDPVDLSHPPSRQAVFGELEFKFERVIKGLRSVDVVGLGSHKFARLFLHFRSQAEMSLKHVSLLWDETSGQWGQQRRAMADWCMYIEGLVDQMENISAGFSA